MLQVTRG